MQRIFAFDEPDARLTSQPPAVAAEPVDPGPEEDFELVVGRRQAIAITFLALVIVVVSSAGSYLAGRALAAKTAPDHALFARTETGRIETEPPEIKLEQPPATISSVPPPAAPMLQATIVPPAKPAEAPIYGNPVPQAIYIQVGAVEKGVAVVLAEGLRKHALDSFVAPGPGPKSFRVLIGPFPDAEAYQKARNVVAEIGLDSFARRYQEQ